MPQNISNLRILTHDERSEIEAQITSNLGEALDDLGLVTDNLSWTWDREKSVLIVEKYSETGNAIEFYEVRPVVTYVGNGRHTDEQV